MKALGRRVIGDYGQSLAKNTGSTFPARRQLSEALRGGSNVSELSRRHLDGDGAPGRMRFRPPLFIPLTQGLEQSQPSVSAIAQRSVMPAFSGTIAPAAPGLQHVNDATQHTPVANATSARLVLGQMRFDRTPLRLAQRTPVRHDPSSDVSELESLFAKK